MDAQEHEELQTQKKQIEADLELCGLTGRPFGNVLFVDLLYVCARPLSEVSGHYKTALDNAAVALGFSKINTTVLSMDDARAELQGSSDSLDRERLALALNQYIDILDPYSVIFLEAELQELLSGEVQVNHRSPKSKGEVNEMFFEGRKFAVATDFFAGIDDKELQAWTWQQMRPARYIPLYK